MAQERNPLLDMEESDVVTPLRASSVPPVGRNASSFISGGISNYAKFNNIVSADRKLAQDAKQSECKPDVVCLISLATPADTDRALDWINVQISNSVQIPYLLDEFLRYCEATRHDVRDPTRALRNLNHMYARARYSASLPQSVREITSDQLTDDFLYEKIISLVLAWRDNIQLQSIPEFHMGIFMNIGVWDRAGFIHDLDANQARGILIGKPTGSWMLRKSSKSTISSFRTVFAISYRMAEEVMHIRFLLIHGVGLYSLTYTFNGLHPINLSDAQLNAPMFTDMLAHVDYAGPTFPCITKMLEYLGDRRMIELGRFLTVHDV